MSKLSWHFGKPHVILTAFVAFYETKICFPKTILLLFRTSDFYWWLVDCAVVLVHNAWKLCDKKITFNKMAEHFCDFYQDGKFAKYVVCHANNRIVLSICTFYTIFIFCSPKALTWKSPIKINRYRETTTYQMINSKICVNGDSGGNIFFYLLQKHPF